MDVDDLMLLAPDQAMTQINANKIVGTGFPTDEGCRLAESLLSNPAIDWSSLEIDLTQCDSALLISAFFNSFLQTVYERESERLPQAREVRWKLEFPFQRANVDEWMRDFQPFSVH